jgi:hypothetical protein
VAGVWIKNKNTTLKYVSVEWPEDGVGSGDDGRVVCECGSWEFKLEFTGTYELTAECARCGNRDVIYEG